MQIATIGDINVYNVTADPNGSLEAPIGSVAFESDTGNVKIWLNADGGTLWENPGKPTQFIADSVPVQGAASPELARFQAITSGDMSVSILRTGTTPATSGTYVLEVLVNGVSRLSSPVDLTATPASADVWVPINLTSTSIAAGDYILVYTSSDNVDLTPAPVGNVEQGTIYGQVTIR